MIKRWLVLCFMLVVTIAGAISPLSAQSPTPMQNQGETAGRVALITRSAYRETLDVYDPDISRLSSVITYRPSQDALYVKTGAPPLETVNTIILEYLFDLGCNQYVDCFLDHYDLAEEGGSIIMSIGRFVSKFEYLSQLVRYNVNTGEVVSLLTLDIEDAVQDVVISGDSTIVAWVNRHQTDNSGSQTIHLYDGETSTLVTVGYDGSPVSGISANPSFSANGQWLSYDSTANNLTPNDSGMRDIFIYNSLDQTTQRITLGYDGSAPNGDSYEPKIDATGRYITFVSEASNLVPEDTNGTGDIFLYDRINQTMRRISVAVDGSQANALSRKPSIAQDGNAVAFVSSATNLVPNDTNGVDDAFVYHLDTNTLRRASVASNRGQATAAIGSAQISVDGGYVLFDTDASLEPQDRGGYDIYVNAIGNRTYRVNYKSFSITPDGNSRLVTNAISADGRYIVFNSTADNLLSHPLPIPDGDRGYYSYMYDRSSGRVTTLPLPENGIAFSLSGDGRFILFRRPANENLERYDRLTGETAIVNTRQDGTVVPFRSDYLNETVISANGRYVVMALTQTDLVPGAYANCNFYCTLVYVKDMESGAVTHVTVASDGTPANLSVAEHGVAISDDGMWVAYVSDASNLVENDTNNMRDVFIHNTVTRETRRVSVSNEGEEGNHISSTPLSFSNDGHLLMFSSRADNLSPEDVNGTIQDSFLYDIQTETLEIIPVTDDGTITDSGTGRGILSGDGNTVAFDSPERLVATDPDDAIDTYLRDLTTGEMWLATITYGNPEPFPIDSSGLFALSDDGTILAFAHDHLTWLDYNNKDDIYYYDRNALPLTHRLFLPTLRY